ncbi:MAG: hypothetical protein ACRECW_00680 [Phyllobacterium sp.]
MSTCENIHLASAEYRDAPGYWERFKQAVMTLENDVKARKRRRATERALDRISEHLRCDIGWPDLYERQTREQVEHKLHHHE